MNWDEMINELTDIITELDARERSNNCVIPHLLDKSWNELCEYGCELFIKLKNK